MRSWFVKVNSDGFVSELWDSTPPVPVGTDGWKLAEFVIPNIDDKKQKLGEIIYDLEKDPVYVTYEIIDYTVDERKKILLDINEYKFNTIIDQLEKVPGLITSDELKQIKMNASENKKNITSCTSHSQLDSLTLKEVSLI